jgi:hypothetical protein
MPTDFSGIQVTALHGLLQNTGIAAPNISTQLSEYVKYAAIQSYYLMVSNLTSSPLTGISVSSINGVAGEVTVASGTYLQGQSLKLTGVVGGTGSGLVSGTTYYVLAAVTGTSIQLTNSYSNAINGVAGLTTVAGTVTGATFETRTGAPVTEKVTIANTIPGDDVTKVFTPTYTTSYTVTGLTWLTNDFIQVDINGTVKTPGVHYSFNGNFSQITFVTAPTSSETVTIKILPRKIFYSLCKDFPMAVGSTPQQFISYWGDGELIRRAYARTSGWFNSDGCKTFANVLGQAQGYASQTGSVLKSASVGDFGTGGPAAGATGGLTKIAGNSSTDLATVGVGFNKASALINLQSPYASFSACQVLNELIKNNAEKVGNLHVIVLGKTFTDPATQKVQTIDGAFVADQIKQAQTNKIMLKDTITDKAIRDLIDRSADSADIASIQQFLKVTATGVTKFSQLLDPATTVGATALNLIQTTTTETDAILGLAKNLAKFVKVNAGADARTLGSGMQQMQNIPGSDLNALTKPTTEAQMNTLLTTLGTGSGAHGRLKAEDCLGQTNYNLTMAEAVNVLKKFHTGTVAVGDMATIVSEFNTIREKIQSGTTTDWDVSLVTAKTNTETLALQLAIQCTILKLSDKIKLYNRVAETHNMSYWLNANVPYYVQGGGVNTVIAFVTNLPNYGKNTDDFSAQQLIEDCADSSVTGQAIVAAMREGKNVQALELGGVGSDTGSESARAVPVPETGVGLVGGGAWPAPSDPYASLPRSSTGF